LYIAFQDWVEYIYLAGFAAVAFGAVLATIVTTLKKKFKITNNIGAFICVVISMIIIHYAKWNMFFALWYFRYDHIFNGVPFNSMFTDFGGYINNVVYFMRTNLTNIGAFMNDFREFNEFGTWSTTMFNIGDVTGGLLAFIWIAELLIITKPPIWYAKKSAGIFLHELDTWAEPQILPFRFSEFTEEELERIESRHDTNIITSKPPADLMYGKYTDVIGTLNKSGVFFVSNEKTEYIAVYRQKLRQFQSAEKEEKPKRKHLATIRLSRGIIDEMIKKLEEIHNAHEVSGLDSDLGSDSEKE
ncbi:MAG: hypothetical protein FWD01_04505, partial [Defluviitaleaceae bacterium]|nr:hypothetical protein [Defluviitaleaceae bacterium]